MRDRTPDVRARKVSRRGLLTVGGGTLGAAIALGPASALGHGTGAVHAAELEGPRPGEEWVSGAMVAVESPSAFTLALSDGTRIPVRLTDDAEVSKEGPASLSDYAPGDEISAGGRMEGGAFVATAVEAVFRLVDSKVTGRSGKGLETDRGPVEIDAGTLAEDGEALGLDLTARQAQPGDRVVALGRRNRMSGRFVADRVGVVTGRRP